LVKVAARLIGKLGLQYNGKVWFWDGGMRKRTTLYQWIVKAGLLIPKSWWRGRLLYRMKTTRHPWQDFGSQLQLHKEKLLGKENYLQFWRRLLHPQISLVKKSSWWCWRLISYQWSVVIELTILDIFIVLMKDLFLY